MKLYPQEWVYQGIKTLKETEALKATFFIHHNRLSLRKCVYLELKSLEQHSLLFIMSWKKDPFVNKVGDNSPLAMPRDWQRGTSTCLTFMQCIYMYVWALDLR
jgi:hypothetical protein